MAPPPRPSPPSSPAGSQYTQQFLSTALSQCGPGALPYIEDLKWHIRQHLVALADAFPSLQPRSSSFTHNDGRTSNLLQAGGTIPISYHGVCYNLPASIWLLEPYPRSPPAVFLSPTHDMVIKPGHSLVDRSGSVRSPYLHSWVFPSSNLVDLVRSLSQAFSVEPPLFSSQRPPNPNPNPIPRPPPPTSLAAPAPSPPPARIYPLQSPYSRPPLTEDPSEVFRRNAASKIVDSVGGDLFALRKAREAEMEGLFATQGALRPREEELSVGIQSMLAEKEGLEQQLQVMLMNADVLGGWVKENAGSQWGGGGSREAVDVDDAFVPAGLHAQQALDCTAADLAAEDTIYALDRAVQEGAISFEMYLRSVRALSREQFFHRATGAKIRAMQVQAHVSSMAARAPPQQPEFAQFTS